MIGISPGSLIEDLKRDPKALRLAIKQYFAADEAGAGLCLILDQFEEVFTLCRDEGERNAYIEAIMSVTTLIDMPVKLILILRADFYGRCAQFSKLAKLLSDNQTLVGKMSGDEFREAIMQPAERVGLRLETGLVELLIEEIRGEAGALPMLSHALRETWKLRRGNLLTVEGYIETGGIRGAIAETAETIYQMLPKKSQAIARQIFLRLAEIEDENMATSRPSTLSEFITDSDQDVAIHQILEQLTQARLLTMDDEKVAVAHETLFTQWPALAKWLQEDMEGLRIHKHLAQAALDWHDRGRDKNELYRGTRLAQTREWSASNKDHLSAIEKEFLRQGFFQANLRRRRLTMGAAILLLIFSALSTFSIIQGRNAQKSEATAIESRNEMEKQRDIALAHKWGATGQLLLDHNGKGPLISALLGVESLGVESTLEGDQILREVLQMLPKPIVSTNHGWHVNEIKFSPEGDFIAIASYSDTDKGTCKVLDTFTGEEISVMGYDGEVYDVDISPLGNKIVCGGSDGIAKVWDPFSGSEISHVDHSEPVNTVAFSPDGNMVISGSEDVTAIVWDANSGQILARIVHDGSVSEAAFLQEGEIVVSCGKNLLVWDARTGEQVMEIPDRHWGISAIAISPDGNTFASAANTDGIRIWSMEAGAEIFHVERDDAGSISDLVFSDDGNLLISGDMEGHIQIWELSRGEVKYSFSHYGDLNWINAIDYSPENPWIMSGANDSTARIWDATTGEELFRIFESGAVYDVAFSPDGKYAATGGLDGSLRIWELKGWNGTTASKDFETIVMDAKFDPSGQLVVIGEGDNNVRIWNLISGKDTSWTAHLEGKVNSIAISKNGRFILSGGSDGFARLWDSLNEFVGVEIEHDVVLDVAFSPNHRIAASGGCDNRWRGSCTRGYVKIWDITNGEIIAQYRHDNYVSSIDFSPDGKQIISGSRDGTIIIWDVENWEESNRITYDLSNWGGIINSVVFHPNGEWIASGEVDGSIRVWDLIDNHEIIRMTHDSGSTSINFNEVNSIDFSPDGNWIVSGSNDYSVRVWRVDTGEEIARMHHDREVTAVSFSPDGRTILSSSLDGTAKIWLWKSNDLIEIACERIVRNMTTNEWQQYIGSSTDFRESCPKPLFSEER
jgi:WD40 repeat protein